MANHQYRSLLSARILTICGLALFAILCVSSVASADLVTYWTFNEGTFTDESGNGYTGNVGGTAPTVTDDGIVGKTFKGSGSGKYNINVSAGNVNMNNFSVSFWGKQTGANWKDYISVYSSKYGDSDFQRANDSLCIYNSPWGTFSADMNLSSGFHHIVFTSDPETGDAKLYVDGNLRSTINKTDIDGAISNLMLGGNFNTGNRNSAATVDEVQFYNQPLTAEQVQFLYNNPSLYQASVYQRSAASDGNWSDAAWNANGKTGQAFANSSAVQFNAQNSPSITLDKNITANSIDFNGSMTVSGSNTITLNGEKRIGVANAGDVATISAPITAQYDNSFVKTGAGTLELTAANSFAGGTTVSAGTLKLSGNGAVGSVAVADNGTLELGYNSNKTYDSAISGTGSVVKSGAGTLTLSGSYSYTGETTVSGGTLLLPNGSSLQTPKITVASESAQGATFQTGTDLYYIDLEIGQGGTFVFGETSASQEITIGNLALNGGTVSFDFNDVGSEDADWLYVTSASLNSGIINLKFNDSSADDWWAAIKEYDGFPIINGTITDYENFNPQNVKVAVNGTVNNSWSLEAESGQLFLLAVDGGDDPGPGPGPGPDPGDNTWYDANTSDIYESSWTIDGTNKVGAKFTDGGSDAPFSGNVYMNADGTFNVGANKNLTLSNSISGSGAMDKTGEGTLTLGAANSNFTGATKVSEGTLALTAQNAISNSSSVENNGAITMGAAQSLNNLSGTGTIDNGGNALTLNNTAPSEFSGVISGSGTMVKSGSGTLTLSGANTYTGATTVNAGALTLASGGALASNDITVGPNTTAEMTIQSGATVTTNGAIYVGLDNGSDGTLNIEGGTVNAYWLRPGRNAGSKGVVNISGGVVTFSKPSTVSGYDESEIGNNGSGKITVSGDAKLNFSGTVRIANMGKAESFINIQDYGEMTVKSLFVGQRGTNLGSMTLSGHAKLTIDNELNVGTNSGSKGTGTMTLKDYATVTLGGTARSYVGYNAGTSTLNVSDNASFTVTGKGFLIGESGAGVINQTGGTITLKTTEGQVFLADAKTGKGTLNISGGKLNLQSTLIAGTRGTAIINLSGTGEINADATVVLAPGYETTSNTTVNQTGGTFNANNGIVYGNYFANRGTGVYKLSGGTLNSPSIKYGSQTPASASFEVSGGVANITGEVAVPTTVSGGTLNANSIAIPAGKELAVSGGTVNLGAGGITAAGAYTVNLSGGTLATKGASWSSALNATVTDAVTFAPESGQSITWNGALSGSGSVAKSGAGTLTLTGSNTYSGETTVNGGTLVLPSSASLATSQITVNSGAFQTSANLVNVGVDMEGGSLILGTPDSVATITVGDFVLDGGAVLYDFFDSSSIYNYDYLYTNDATLTSGTINIAFNNNDEDDWWDKNTDSGYILIESLGLTADDLSNIRLLVNSERTTKWTLDTDGDNLVLKNQTEPQGDLYYRAESEEERAEENWTIDGDDKVGVTFTEGDENAVTYSGGVAMEDNGTFEVADGKNLTLAGVVSGDGEVEKIGDGTLTLSGNNTNTGKTTVSEGTLALTGAAVKANNSIEVAQDATLEYNVAAGDSKQLTFSDDVTVSGAGDVVKTGAGKLKILAADGQFESSTFAVNAGELDFKGQYNGDLTVKSGATLSPGNSVGDLTVYGDVKIDASGTLLFEFSPYNADPAMQEFDTLAITDASNELVLDTNSIVKLFFTSAADANLWAAEGEEYKLVSDEGFVSNVTDMSDLLGNYTSLFALQGRPDGLYLIGLGAGPAPEPGSGVPEPSTWALLVLGVVALFLRKRVRS